MTAEAPLLEQSAMSIRRLFRFVEQRDDGRDLAEAAVPLGTKGALAGGALRPIAFAAAALLVVGGAAMIYWASRPVEPPAQRSEPVAETRSPALIKLDAERHKLQLVRAAPGDVVRISMLSDGVRGGDYRLRVQISEQVYRKVLATSDEIVTLPVGPYEDSWEIESQTVGQAYASRVLNANPGDVQVEENFVVTVTLEPKLTEEELSALDPGERARLAGGALVLESKARTEYLSRMLITR